MVLTGALKYQNHKILPTTSANSGALRTPFGQRRARHSRRVEREHVLVRFGKSALLTLHRLHVTAIRYTPPLSSGAITRS